MKPFISSFLLMFIFILGYVSMSVGHPVPLMGVLVMLVAVLSGLLCLKVSAFYSFVLFMVVAGGMLVVFAYCMALSPNPTFYLTLHKSSWVMSLVMMGWGLSESGDLFSIYLSGVETVLSYNFTWGMMSLFLCILLFLIMVAVAAVCGLVSGALIKSSR